MVGHAPHVISLDADPQTSVLVETLVLERPDELALYVSAAPQIWSKGDRA